MQRMTRRCHGWDYCAPSIYMFTLTLQDRHQPLLGKIAIDHYSNNPEEIQAHLAPSPLGQAITQLWKTPNTFPAGVSPLLLQLMEEHLHFILWAQQRLLRPIGKEIAVFKARCTQIYHEMFQTSLSLFSPGFQDSILLHQGQLKRMFEYIADNPRRLAIKRLFPDFFCASRDVPFANGFLSCFGNTFLLHSPRFYQIQASRQISIASPLFSQLQAKLISEINRKVTIVSTYLSEIERKLTQMVLQQNGTLIVLRNNGFPQLYKPATPFFNACAQGRLLMLAPVGYGVRLGHPKLTRLEACVLNTIAQQICGADAQPIIYHNPPPSNLEHEVYKALQYPNSL